MFIQALLLEGIQNFEKKAETRLLFSLNTPS